MSASMFVNGRGSGVTKSETKFDFGDRFMTKKVYEPPRVQTLDNEALMATLGPSLSCTGFGGSVSC